MFKKKHLIYQPTFFAKISIFFLFLSPLYISGETLNEKMLQKMFVEPHLNEIKSKGTIEYAFQGYSHNDGEFFKDSLLIHIIDINSKNLKTITSDIFSGERKRYFPKLRSRYQNPLLLIFLQRDANETAQVLNIKSQSIKFLVKRAFRKAMNTEKIQVTTSDRKLSCLRSTIQPLAKEDPAIYRDFVRKEYRFTFCPEIPGKIYEIETDVKNQKGVSLFIERVRFVNFKKEK